jgi:hypothetical protein
LVKRRALARVRVCVLYEVVQEVGASRGAVRQLCDLCGWPGLGKRTGQLVGSCKRACALRKVVLEFGWRYVRACGRGGGRQRRKHGRRGGRCVGSGRTRRRPRARMRARARACVRACCVRAWAGGHTTTASPSLVPEIPLFERTLHLHADLHDLELPTRGAGGRIRCGRRGREAGVRRRAGTDAGDRLPVASPPPPGGGGEGQDGGMGGGPG